ncbi:MAG TPA: hypothetical protein VI112_04200 [Bacteroidia bacterium]|jgi:hypothetical protein
MKKIFLASGFFLLILQSCGPKPVTQEEAGKYIDRFKKITGKLGDARAFAKEWDRQLPLEQITSDNKIVIEMTKKYNQGLIDNQNKYLRQLVDGLTQGSIIAQDSLMKLDTIDGGGAMKTTALEMAEAFKKASTDEYPKLLALRMAGDTVQAKYDELWKALDTKLTPVSKKFSDARRTFGEKFNIHMLELNL